MGKYMYLELLERKLMHPKMPSVIGPELQCLQVSYLVHFGFLVPHYFLQEILNGKPHLDILCIRTYPMNIIGYTFSDKNKKVGCYRKQKYLNYVTAYTFVNISRHTYFQLL